MDSLIITPTPQISFFFFSSVKGVWFHWKIYCDLSACVFVTRREKVTCVGVAWLHEVVPGAFYFVGLPSKREMGWCFKALNYFIKEV